MTTVKAFHFMRIVTLYVILPLQLTVGWQGDNMATVTNKRKDYSVERKVKVVRQIENGKEESWCVSGV